MSVLPEPVRSRVVALAAATLGALPAPEVPASLRHVARFTPAKRVRLGSADLLAALEAEPLFRQAVASRVRDLADPAPAERAAAAYLLRTDGWEEQVAALAQEAAPTFDADAATRLSLQLEQVRAQARADVARAREEAEEAKTELTAVRRKARDTGARVGRAEQAERQAQDALAGVTAELEQERATHAEQVRGLQDKLTDAERALNEVRATVREGAKGEQLRLRLLLDAVVGAAQGLRRELALPPAHGRPADSLAADYPPPSGAPTPQGRLPDDPGLLDALLAVPTTHLLVDGYNVTKTGYASMTLEAQRSRLLAGLGALVARTGVEVTVVFDGADGSVPVALPAPRGVRLLFSRTGETADEVLRRLVRHEPAGRPLVVVSSDKEVADGVRLVGAHAVPALGLVRLLDR